MEKFRMAIAVTAAVMMVVIPVIAFLLIAAPAQLRYNKLFGAHVVMAYDQANFEGMEANFAPMAYWLWWWIIPIEVVLLVLALVCGLSEW
jgi:hypothetical protein